MKSSTAGGISLLFLLPFLSAIGAVPQIGNKLVRCTKVSPEKNQFLARDISGKYTILESNKDRT